MMKNTGGMRRSSISFRFLCFGEDSACVGTRVRDQIHTFSCSSVLHNAVVV